MNKSSPLLLLLGLSVSGCSLMPDYMRPGLPVERTFQTRTENMVSPVLDWQAFFLDPALRQLIRLALDNNRDLRSAALNVEAYQAQYRVARSDLFPKFGLTGVESRRRIPAGTTGGMSGSGNMTTGGTSGTSSAYTGTGSSGSSAVITSWYAVSTDVSWELDLFGRINSLRTQALEQFFASEAARRGVQISLVASVANAWLTWQADQARLELSRDTLKTYEETLRLTQTSFEVGNTSALEVRQAQTSVDSTRAVLETYARAVLQDRNALVLLAGRQLPEELVPKGKPEDHQLAGFPVGMVSDLLLQRPDIMEAEFRLKAANANIGAARAAFFPKVALTASGGTAGGSISDLFTAGSGYWSFIPSITVPIFRAGELMGNLDYAKISKDMQVASYEKAIQTAFREVNDGLAARTTYRRQVAAQHDLVDTTQDYYRLADLRYQTGIDSYLTFLDAQRQLFSARQQLISDQLNQQITEVNLFKALGGGWQDAVAAGNSSSPAAAAP